jgi:hypothetical protein
LACTVCNSYWKQTIFPVRKKPRPLPPTIAALKKEGALLLNPFYGPDPGKHLEFDRDGVVRPRNRSRLGRETILTCGLNRPSLQERRKILADKTHRRLDDLPRLRGSELRRVLRDIRDDGHPMNAGCGMVRAIYEQRTGLQWSELENKLG